jgi:putative hydrolase of the HAD superfamily
MKFNPKAIFFDWDHTLWDHDRNAREVILDLVDEFNLTNTLESDQNDIWNRFNVLNNQLWDDYQSKKITQLELRESRFKCLFIINFRRLKTYISLRITFKIRN